MCYRTAVFSFNIGKDASVTEDIATFQNSSWVDYFGVTEGAGRVDGFGGDWKRWSWEVQGLSC